MTRTPGLREPWAHAPCHADLAGDPYQVRRSVGEPALDPAGTSRPAFKPRQLGEDGKGAGWLADSATPGACRLMGP